MLSNDNNFNIKDDIRKYIPDNKFPHTKKLKDNTVVDLNKNPVTFENIIYNKSGITHYYPNGPKDKTPKSNKTCDNIDIDWMMNHTNSCNNIYYQRYNHKNNKFWVTDTIDYFKDEYLVSQPGNSKMYSTKVEFISACY